MLERYPSTRRLTVGADRGYDTRDFVETCRLLGITPHVARRQRSLLDGRTTRHPGYRVSQRVRKRIEEINGGSRESPAGPSCVTEGWPETSCGPS